MSKYLTIRWVPSHGRWIVLDGEDVVADFPSMFDAEQYIIERDEDET